MWHEIDAASIRRYSAPLANKLALQTSRGLNGVADGIAALFTSQAEIRRLEAVAAGKGYFYRSINFQARLEEQGSRWLVRWQASIVSEIDALHGIRVSYRVDDLVPESLTDAVIEPDISVETHEADHPRAVERFFRFASPLKRGEERVMTNIRTFRKRDRQERDMFVSKGALRCDDLTLRVSFDEQPCALTWRTTDRAETVRFHEDAALIVREVDGVSATQNVPMPDLAAAYGFYWQYSRR